MPTTIITYLCRYCNTPMAETTAPADRTYVYLECTNTACRWCCACELAPELLQVAPTPQTNLMYALTTSRKQITVLLGDGDWKNFPISEKGEAAAQRYIARLMLDGYTEVSYEDWREYRISQVNALRATLRAA